MTGAAAVACLLALYVLATYLFVLGYFPQPAVMSGHAVDDSGPAVPAKFQRLVLLVVDALRADFVLDGAGGGGSGGQSQFDYVRSLLQATPHPDTGVKALAFRAQAHAPTVTLPRIKAMVTGNIPSFLDLLHNFDSSALHEDNLIWQLKHAPRGQQATSAAAATSGRHRGDRRTLVFYGDDTWLKLFPAESGVFAGRSEGTTSFFVQDTVMVDRNVTQAMLAEFARLSPTPAEGPDWDVLILHYLGLDHVGHSDGRHSRLMPGKQREMDRVFQFLHQAVGPDTLLVLASDHGMSEAGGHGGSSPAESSALFVLAPGAGDGLAGAPAPPPYEFFESESPPPAPPSPAASARIDAHSVAQIDLAPSLALLMGVPLPRSSIGTLLPGLLVAHGYSPAEQLRALAANAEQVWRVVQSHSQLWNQRTDAPARPSVARLEAMLRNAGAAARSLHGDNEGDELASAARLYRMFLGASQSELAAVLTNYNVPLLMAASFVHSTILAVAVACMVAWLRAPVEKAPEAGRRPSASLLLAPVSGWLLWRLVLPVLAPTALFGAPVNGSAPVQLAVALLALLLAQIWTAWRQWARSLADFRIQEIQPIWLMWWPVGAIALALILLAASRLSTSFIEEEHQVRYYVQSLLVAMATIWAAARRIQLPMSAAAVGTAWLLAARLLRSWNQTGVKWLDEGLMRQDVGAWLGTHDMWRHMGVAITLSIMMAAHWGDDRALTVAPSRHRCSRVALLIACVACAVYKWWPDSSGVWPARIALLGAAMAWLTDGHRRRVGHPVRVPAPLVVCFVTLHRPYNAVLWLLLYAEARCALFLLQLALDEPTGRPASNAESTTVVGRLRLTFFLFVLEWSGRAAFFQLANSNAVSTIDIGCAYVGLTEYQPVLVGIMTFVVVFSGPLFFHCVQISVLRQEPRTQRPFALLVLLALVSQLAGHSFFNWFAMAQRHHLFVWSVIAPKYVYEVLDVALLVVRALHVYLCVRLL